MPAVTSITRTDKKVKSDKQLDAVSGVESSHLKHGVEDTICITNFLEANGITCCCVGVSALKFYGATRRRADWEICVPTTLVSKTVDILRSPPISNLYVPINPIPRPQVLSLIHTYARFQKKDSPYTFVIIPADDILLDCQPTNIVRSLRGLPYPSLKVLTQSCLDRRNEVELCDLVDGTNVSEDWGEKELNLEGTNDTEWAWRMKRLTKEWNVKKEGKPQPIDFWPTRPKDRRLIWQSQVRTKAERLDWSRPPEIYVTQYRLHDSPDPWTVVSDVS